PSSKPTRSYDLGVTRRTLGCWILGVAMAAGACSHGPKSARQADTPVADAGVPVPEGGLKDGEAACSTNSKIAATLVHANDKELTERGAADGLPEHGATTLERVRAAVRVSSANIRRQFPSTQEITVGPGLGLTYTQLGIDTPRYVREPDYQVYVHLGQQADCAKAVTITVNDPNQRDPICLAYPSGCPRS